MWFEDSKSAVPDGVVGYLYFWFTRNRKYFPSVETVADGPIYCIRVEYEVGFEDSKSAVTDAFSLPVWPETAVEGRFSVTIHAIWPRVTCGRV